MKRVIMLFAAVTMMVAAVSCNQNTKKVPKMLIVYYSQTSNTKVVADEIQHLSGADVEVVIPVNPYSGTYQETIERSAKEREEGILPEIEPLKANLADYDVIFLGYPIWFGTYAPPIATLLSQIDLNGKKVVPFCTFGSGGLESSVNDLKAKFPNAEILEGYGVRAARLDAVPYEVDQFLKANGFIEGEFVKLPEFSEPKPVTEEESAIFDKAVEGYRMLNAKASEVALRDIPNGKEYLFMAVNTPRPDGPQMPASEIKVYVTVQDGQEPVFTKVVR
ncbi:MAG: NAD(P)H-dependent oxidoreductase [Bacteroidales bacterium]|nr:NAD(P)H-dependent oxidoreductase [Bacteroidales bacterium]